MSKHIIDHDHAKGDGSSRTARYTEKERAEMPGAASLAAQRTSKMRSDEARLKAFTKIERQEA